MTKVNAALNFLERRFGIRREVFEDYALIEEKDVWITSKEASEFEMKFWRRKGIRLVRIFKKGFKFTTSGMQMFGKYAIKNVVTISEDELKRFLKGENVKIIVNNVEEGQVIVKFGDDVIGSAIYKDGMLKNQLPKGRRLL